MDAARSEAACTRPADLLLPLLLLLLQWLLGPLCTARCFCCSNCWYDGLGKHL
jgi:hypothetical protein